MAGFVAQVVGTYDTGGGFTQVAGGVDVAVLAGAVGDVRHAVGQRNHLAAVEREVEVRGPFEVLGAEDVLVQGGFDTFVAD